MTQKLEYPNVGDLVCRNALSAVDKNQENLLRTKPKYKLVLEIEKKTNALGVELFRFRSANLGYISNSATASTTDKPFMVTPYMTLESFHTYFLVVDAQTASEVQKTNVEATEPSSSSSQ